MRFLVTGAAGFIASHLCEALVARGHVVVGVDSFSDNYPRELKEQNIRNLRKSSRFHFVEIDLKIADMSTFTNKADVIFHLAARPGLRTSWGPGFKDYVSDNILATQRVLEAAAKTRLRLFVYASTSSVYGQAERQPTPEDCQPKPVSPYGITKHAAEQLCHSYQKWYGVPLLILRYFTTYGPRQRPDMAFNRWLHAALTGSQLIVYGDGSFARDFTHVSDIVRGTIAAAEAGSAGEVYNLGTGTALTLRSVLDTVRQITQRELQIKYAKPQPGDAARTCANISKARRELGYLPSTRLKDGLSGQLQWQSETVMMKTGF